MSDTITLVNPATGRAFREIPRAVSAREVSSSARIQPVSTVPVIVPRPVPTTGMNPRSAAQIAMRMPRPRSESASPTDRQKP